MLTLIRRHAVGTYIALTFFISWGGLLVALGGPGAIPATTDNVDAQLPGMVAALLAGPPVVGLLLIGLVHGRAGWADLMARLRTWRVSPRWYAVALLTGPVLMGTLLLALSLFEPEFLPAIITTDDKAAVLRFGVAVALCAGFFEEIGWTGFLVPALARRFSVLATGLITGFVWALWHVLPAYWLSGTMAGPHATTSFVLDPFLYLIGYRILMVWVYDQCGSLLVAMLMHASLTASARILGAQAIAGWPLVIFDGIWAISLAAIIAAVAAVHGGRLTRHDLPDRPAPSLT